MKSTASIKQSLQSVYPNIEIVQDQESLLFVNNNTSVLSLFPDYEISYLKALAPLVKDFFEDDSAEYQIPMDMYRKLDYTMTYFS